MFQKTDSHSYFSYGMRRCRQYRHSFKILISRRMTSGCKYLTAYCENRKNVLKYKSRVYGNSRNRKVFL